MTAGAHLNEALAAEREAYAEQLAGRPAAAAYRAARDAYLASHAETGPRSRIDRAIWLQCKSLIPSTHHPEMP